MQTLKNIIPFFVLISFLFMTACNESTNTAEKKDADTSTATVTRNDTTTMPAYDPAMDPLTVGAAFSKKLHDSLGIKIFEATLKPGDSMGLHTHPDHAIYILQHGKASFYFPGQGWVTPSDEEQAATAWITGPYTDAVKNIGNTPIKWIEVNIYRPRGIEMPAKPAYDSAIDAFTLGGSSIQKLADTLGMKMFIATMKPGDSATLHSHPDHTVYVLEGGELAVTFQGGARQIMKLEKGMGFVGGPFSDAAKNTGKTTVKLLMTHIYRPGVK